MEQAHEEENQREQECAQARREVETEPQRLQAGIDARTLKQTAEAAERFAREAEARAAEETEEQRIAEMRRGAEEQDSSQRKSCKLRDQQQAL